MTAEVGRTDPENTCQECGGPNPAWSANNAWWNRVMGSPNGIVCPTCFVFRAGGAFGIVPGPGGEVSLLGPAIESAVCEDSALVHGQPVRVMGGRYHGREALWQRFEWKRAGGNGHRRYHLVAVLPGRRGAGVETTCMAVAIRLCPYCSVSLEAQCPTHAKGDSALSGGAA